MISTIRWIITIIMLILLIIQIRYLLKERTGECLLTCVFIQILNIINLILRCYE